MTLSSTISGANLTKIRADKYRAQQFVAAVPDVTVVQFNPSAAPSKSVYAEITVGAVAEGSMSNILSFQTVIFSTTTDYQATETYRTYVRKVSGTSTLYIGQTGQNLTTSHYVTVLNTYDIYEKPRVLRNGTQYANWDIGFRRLLPVESDLPTAVVLIDGATSYSPTANPQAIDNDATTSFTHSWSSSNSNDSLDSGGTTNNPSFTLEAGAHRWIRYTFTDSNGNSNLRVISVWTVPKSLASVVNLGFIGEDDTVATIQYRQTVGWTCDVPAFKSISSLTKGTLVCVFSIEDYNDTRGSIESNIDFVGYLGNEVTVTRGDPQYGRVSETRFTVNGFGAKMQNTPIAQIGITASNTPVNWDDIENPTPVRVIVYLLSEHTTFLHLCALKFPSNHTSFIAPGSVLTSDIDVTFDAVQYQADAMGAILQWGHDGILDITQNLVETDDTARDAASTVAAMTPSDWISYEISYNPEPLLRFLEVFAGVYDTTSGEYDVYNGVVPPVADVRGVDEQQRVNMILTTDLSDSAARSEMAQRCANLYAALNPTVIIRMTLKDEWRFLQPDVGAWYTFTVAVTDTVRGVSYDSNTRWQLLEIGYTSNNRTGRKDVQATFRKETSNTGANIEVTKVQVSSDNEINAVPGVLPPYTGGDLGLTDGNWFDSYDPAPASEETPASADCELLGFRPKFVSGVNTDQAAVTGEAISYQVSGSGKLVEAESINDDFTLAQGDWYVRQDFSTPDPGSYSGSGWSAVAAVTDSGGADIRQLVIVIDLGAIHQITDFSMTFDLTKGSSTNNSLTCYGVTVSNDEQTYSSIGITETYNSATNGTDKEESISIPGGIEGRFIQISIRPALGFTNGSALLKAVTITTQDVYGDALYTWSDNNDPTAYSSGDGLLFEGAQPASIPSYNDAHSYNLFDSSVDSGALIFDFVSPYGTTDMENWSLQILVCFLGVL